MVFDTFKKQLSAQISCSLSALCIVMIRAYQAWVSPQLGHVCRYSPSCSEYAVQAIQKRGVFKGLALSIKRLSSCHPFSKGGFDPVK